LRRRKGKFGEKDGQEAIPASRERIQQMSAEPEPRKKLTLKKLPKSMELENVCLKGGKEKGAWSSPSPTRTQKTGHGVGKDYQPCGGTHESVAIDPI